MELGTLCHNMIFVYAMLCIVSNFPPCCICVERTKPELCTVPVPDDANRDANPSVGVSTVGNSANRHDTLLYLIDIHDPWLQEESYSKRLGVVSPH
mmetsp:Transcript_23356/g.57467  ORF Transcript_23356/g.57467 Transcript_23356/m.57467 type:complete len:96 (+) Transcript_23356:49-336(+)